MTYHRILPEEGESSSSFSVDLSRWAYGVLSCEASASAVQPRIRRRIFVHAPRRLRTADHRLGHFLHRLRKNRARNPAEINPTRSDLLLRDKARRLAHSANGTSDERISSRKNMRARARARTTSMTFRVMILHSSTVACIAANLDFSASADSG